MTYTNWREIGTQGNRPRLKAINLLQIAKDANRLIERIEAAHERGETFPLDVALAAARLSISLKENRK